ncbi:MAG TPA: hypothetical protein VGQ94_06330 [Terriglobales bacterium]|nr:hypothetical protein [Terriglobales bacterium]
MKDVKWIVSAMFALALLLGASAPAQAKKLKKSDLPAAVQKTADEQSEGAMIRGYTRELDGGKVVYEVEMTVQGHSRDVTIAPDGSVVAVEEEVAVDALPAPVREGLQKKAGAGAIARVESITKHGKLVAYEADVRTGKKRSEIQVGPDGKPLAHKE